MASPGVPVEITLATDRAARYQQMRALFPEVGGVDCTWDGSREAALAVLARVDAVAYARTRNHIDGKVSRLSPYFRHGVLTLHEAARVTIVQYGAGAHKFVFELAWRDYWQRVWAARGVGIHTAIESPKVPLGTDPLPDDIREARTGLACMDQFVRDLTETGYVHNHARMWFASYVVHHRKVRWQAGAAWYYGELLDGDRASNTLSWQWIASTFSAKPYIFNRENLEKYTDGVFCARCPRRNTCPFEGSYEALSARLFEAQP
jgi:deoxyribodipyrimidine photo-lyase